MVHRSATWNSFLILVALIAGCNSGTGSSLLEGSSVKLTNQKAQNAVVVWDQGRGGAVTVVGVREVPQDGSAVASIQLTNVTLKINNPFGGQATERTYTGPGEAMFVHYNDGRWVLTKVQTSEGLNSVWWDNLNIEAR
jgi:hypothetical protein